MNSSFSLRRLGVSSVFIRLRVRVCSGGAWGAVWSPMGTVAPWWSVRSGASSVSPGGGGSKGEAPGARRRAHGRGGVGGARHDIAGQAVGAVVGDAHRVVLVVERDHTQHRAEDLFLRDRHGVVDVDEKRWPDEI